MNEEKKKKLARLDKYIERLGVSREDVVEHWQLTSMMSATLTMSSAFKSFSKTDYDNIKPGMFWYEDDTFSINRTMDKKIKAIVELVEDGIIYGDLTASELFDVYEKDMTWNDVRKFFEKFSYPCQKNEKIVWYSIEQFETVYKHYKAIKKAFEKLHKPFRGVWYWSSTERSSMLAWGVNFGSGNRGTYTKRRSLLYVRPVLALKVS
ncbi:MAG: DUF1566 domain-containing protein [Alphaproteobacteria bacterium]|nr:DUF1566 domain-containing protein [Alphaproteobacteria bacterium]